MSILKRLGAFRNKALTHIIDTDTGPQEFRFYPPRMRMVMSGRMRQIMEPITQALGIIFADRKADAAKQQEVQADGSVTTFVQALNPEVIELRQKQREKAIKDALEVLLNESTRYQLGELMADSLRDDFSEDEAERAREARLFMDALTVPTMIEFVKGYLKALAPIMDKGGNSILSGLRETVEGEVKRVLKTQAGVGADDSQDESQSGTLHQMEQPES